MKVFDFYSGYEGKPETTILQQSKDRQNIVILKLWEAYFDRIIELIEPNEKGCREGAAIHYNLATGWFDDGSWECENVPLFLKQLESTDENRLKEISRECIGTVSFDVLQILKFLLKNTIEANGKILIKYD